MKKLITNIKITIKSILNLVLWLSFGSIGALFVFQKKISGIILLLSIAIILIPFTTKLIDQRFKIHISRNTKILITIIGLIIFLLTINTPKPSNIKSTNKQNSIIIHVQKDKQTDNKKNSQILPVNYQIIEIEDQSVRALGGKMLSYYSKTEIENLPINKKMVYRVVVSPKIKESQVNSTVKKIISDITSKDNDIDAIILFLYSDKKLIHDMYDVATAIWSPNGKHENVTPEIARTNNRSNYNTIIQVKENLEKYLQNRGRSENKFGFSETQRRNIFKELVATEDRARTEANKLYPINIYDSNYKQENLMKNADENQKLMEKYKEKLRVKYSITKEVQNKIVKEALEENWPMQ